MSNVSDLMNIGISSLNTYKSALSVVSDNIANANTPYYSRRLIRFTEAGASGGVNVADVQRIFSDQANTNALTSNTNYEQWNESLQLLQNFEPLFDGASTNLSKFISAASSALTDLNGNASSISNRNTYLTKLSYLVSQFQSTSSSLTDQQSNINQSLQSYTAEASELLNSIANLNQQVTQLTPEDRGALLDQRDLYVRQLSSYFNFTTQTDSSGNLNISLSNGMQLVSGGQAQQLVTMVDPSNPSHLLTAIKNGTTNIPINNFIQGGKIAGLINFQTNAVDPSMRALGQLSLAIAGALNTQNKFGIDLHNNFGGNIFTDINSANAITNRVISNVNNTGNSSMTVNINNVNSLTASDYNLVIGPSNTYTLTRISDNASMGSGSLSSLPQTLSFDGCSLNIASGIFNNGDQYVISPTQGAAANISLATTDPTLLALAWPVSVGPSPQTNRDGVQISVTAITNPASTDLATPNQLSPPITVKFLSATTYQLINATNNSIIEAGPINYTPGANIFPTPGGYDPGYQITISGTLQADDSFNIAYNNNSVSDHRNGDLLLGVYSNPIVNGTSTFKQAYNTLSLNISMQTQAAQQFYTSNRAMKDTADSTRDSISGVIIEEEMMNLARYQQSYQSSAQILQSAKAVFESILGIMR